MSLYLQELSDLERLLTLTQSVGAEDWRDCLDRIDDLPRVHDAKGLLSEFLDLVQRIGPAHLEAIREFKRKERNKGCIPAYFRDSFPV